MWPAQWVLMLGWVIRNSDNFNKFSCETVLKKSIHRLFKRQNDSTKIVGEQPLLLDHDRDGQFPTREIGTLYPGKSLKDPNDKNQPLQVPPRPSASIELPVFPEWL